VTKERVVLAVDVGGSHVKALTSKESGRRRFKSGPSLSAEQMVACSSLASVPVSVRRSSSTGRSSHLPFRKKTFEDYVGERGLEKAGKKKWKETVFEAVAQLAAAMEPDEVVLGGGGVDELKELPPGCRRGTNKNAFLGGFRLWDPGWLDHLGERPDGTAAKSTPRG
jgi:hypothetical protein